MSKYNTTLAFWSIWPFFVDRKSCL